MMRWFPWLAALLLLAPVEKAEKDKTQAELLRNERIDRFLSSSMRAGDIDAWIILTREGNFDPLSADFGFWLGRGALIFVDRGGERVERLALVSSLDLVPLRETGIYDRVIGFERNEPFEQKLAELLKTVDAERIGVNMSDTSGIADGLSATYLNLLERALGPGNEDRIVSAEKTILSFRSKKLPAEIGIYRRATAITEAILKEAFTDGFIRPGITTEADLRDHVQQIAARQGFPELAWEKEACPGVYSGVFKDLSHAAPTEDAIQPGDILWIDFGIRVEGYVTDMIRCGYVLRPGETRPPEEVQKMFDTLKRANEAAVAAMKPGVAAWKVDKAARDVVTESGYPEFFHSTGHPVGVLVHDAGPSLGPRSSRYGPAVELPLEAGQIFAVEPSVMLPKPELGGSFVINMEEEVLVTKDGARYLAPHQTELYLIASPQ